MTSSLTRTEGANRLSLEHPDAPEVTREELELAAQDPVGLAEVASWGQFLVAPHIELINDVLLDIAEGKADKVMIFAPPRHAKSTTVSHYFPAWFLGTSPQKRVILTSYGADQASKFGRLARDVLEEFGPWAFGVRVRPSSSASNRWDLQVLQGGRWVNARGGMNTAGARGALTGKGADLLIIDDPVKDEKQAKSALIQEDLDQWWRATAAPRVEAGGAAVMMLTRWHEKDLPGRILAREGRIEDGGRWLVVELPALARDPATDPNAGEDPLGRSPGEALWPEMFPKPVILERKIDLGEFWFAAEYQQRPQPASGGTFKREWLRYYYEDEHGYEKWLYLEGAPDVVDDELPPDAPAMPRKFSANACWCFATTDLAVSTKEGADFTVVAVWLVTPHGDLLLDKVVRRRMEGPDHLPLLWEVYNEYVSRGIAFIGIERAQYQLALLQTAVRSGLPAEELNADKDKVARAQPAASMAKRGRFYIKAGMPGVGAFVEELLAFPTGTYDDQVDTLGYAAERVLLAHAGEWRRGPNDPPAATNEGPFGPVDDPPFTEHFGRPE